MCFGNTNTLPFSAFQTLSLENLFTFTLRRPSFLKTLATNKCARERPCHCVSKTTTLYSIRNFEVPCFPAPTNQFFI